MGGWNNYDLNEREWGQTGVKRIAGTLGWTMEPPAATEYAVLPVGVASNTPSAWTCKLQYLTILLGIKNSLALEGASQHYLCLPGKPRQGRQVLDIKPPYPEFDIAGDRVRLRHQAL